jgi:hypothetical protein
MPKLIDSIVNELDNKIYLALFIAAIFSTFTGFFSEEGWLGWIQGISIILGLLILVTFAAVSDLIKDKYFIRLQSWYQKGRIGVVRGKKGYT